MDFTENKFELSIAGMILLLIAGLFHLFGSLHGHTQNDGDIIYEMPRPKSFQGADLDLSNREIDRDYVNPFVKKDTKTIAATTKKPVKAAAKKDAAKKDAMKKETAKKAQVSARVIGKSGETGLGDDSVSAGAYGNYANGGRAQATENTAQTTDDKNDDTKLSPDQWIALILAQPTKGNMDKLIEARNKNEVDSGTYNTIVTELLKSSKSDVQDLGLYGAQTFPDAQSFVTVAQNKEHLSSDEQAKAEKFLQTYTQASRLNSLTAVLTVPDEAVVQKATEIILAGYQKAKGGIPVSGTDPRNGRGGVVISSVNEYQKFIAVYQHLAQSSDGAIAALANSALSVLSALAQNPTV